MARKHSGKPWLHGATGWWCTTVDGKRRKLDRDYRVACRKLKALRSEQKREQAGGHDWLDVRFAELADEYLADSMATKKAATYESRRYRLLRALRILGTTVRVGELRKSHLGKIERELAKAEYSPTTIKDTIAEVQGVLNWAVSRDLLDTTPLAGYQKPRPRRRARIITPDEFKSLLRRADRNFRRVLVSLRVTGCRPAEVRELIWEWVDFDRALWIIPEHKTVTRQQEPRPRIIPLPTSILRLCERLAREPHNPADHVFLNQRGRPYTKDCFVRKMDRLRKRAGIEVKGGEQIVLYSHRHTFGTENTGRVSDIELAELMGHTEVRTTHRYVHLNTDRLHDIRRRAHG